MKKYYLELQGLYKSYFDGSGDHHILKGADLKIEKGETVAILGSSGSGKSTLLNLIAGIDLPDQGEVRIDGKSLGQMSEKNRTLLRRRNMGFVFQSFNLIPTLNVYENLMLPLELNQISKNSGIVSQMLEALGLKGREESHPDRLSGGEQQRVAIARSLAMNPDIMLFDEPTSALDVTIQSQILDLLSDLKAKLKITIILISHDISVVKYFSDRIIVMYNGEIIESGNSKDIISVPKNNYTKKLMSSVFSLKK